MKNKNNEFVSIVRTETGTMPKMPSAPSVTARVKLRLFFGFVLLASIAYALFTKDHFWVKFGTDRILIGRQTRPALYWVAEALLLVGSLGCLFAALTYGRRKAK
jgi:hypothetical protein